MFWITILLFAFAACADSFIIGFNYGVKGVRIGHAANAFLSLICLMGTALSMLAGRLAGSYLDRAVTDVLGGFLFLLLGLWMLKGALRPKKSGTQRTYTENPDLVDKDLSRVIELRESALIGLLLCLNNVGLGIGGGMAGMPVLLTPLVSALLSYLFIWSGYSVGRRITNRHLSKALEVLASLFILGLGLGELGTYLF